MSHYQVLIADDDVDSAALLRRQIRDVLGKDAECVRTRQEMNSRANGHELLFVDLKLEGSVDDTIAELRVLRENYPVVIVTGQSDPTVLREVASLELCLLEKGEYGTRALFYGCELAKQMFKSRQKLRDQEQVLLSLKSDYEKRLGQVADKGQ